MADYLAVNFRGPGLVRQVYAVTGATASQIGLNVPGTLEQSTAVASTVRQFIPFGRAVRLLGATYVQYNNGLFRNTDNAPALGGAWTQVVTFTNPPTGTSGNDAMHYGPWNFYLNNRQYLCGLWRDGATALMRAYRYDVLADTSVQSTVGFSSAVPTTAYYNPMFVGRNMAYVSAENGSSLGMFGFDPVALAAISLSAKQISATSSPPPGLFWLHSPSGTLPMVMVNGRLYCFADQRAANGVPATVTHGLFQFSGNTVRHVFQVSSGTTPSTNSLCGAAFYDGTNLIGIRAASGGGFRVFSVSFGGDGEPSSSSDVTVTVLPVSLQAGGGFGVTNNSQRVSVIVESDPVGAADIRVLVAPDGLTTDSWTIYQWNGIAATMSLIATGLPASYAVPLQVAGGSLYLAPNAGPSITVLSRARASNGAGMVLTYRCFGGQLNQFVRAYKKVGAGNEFDPVIAQQTLVGSATGGASVRVGNEIQSVDCDGVTDYTLTVSNADLTENDAINMLLRVSNS